MMLEQDSSQRDLQLPENPGPALTGSVPVIGIVRRSLGFPVLRDALQGLDSADSPNSGFEDFSSSDSEPDLPENVVLSTDNPDDEQIEIAKERADEFNRVVLMEEGKVKGVGHGSGGSVTLREYQGEPATTDSSIAISKQ